MACFWRWPSSAHPNHGQACVTAMVCPAKKIYDLCLWMLLCSLIGSKILMLFTEPEYRDPSLQLISLDFLRSGGVFYGG
jgi:hypothetical protein